MASANVASRGMASRRACGGPHTAETDDSVEWWPYRWHLGLGAPGPGDRGEGRPGTGPWPGPSAQASFGNGGCARPSEMALSVCTPSR